MSLTSLLATIFVILVAAVILLVPAKGGIPWPPLDSIPARYDGKWRGKTHIQALSFREVQKLCETPRRQADWACQWMDGKVCMIVMVRIGEKVDGRIINQAGYDGTLRHELAHCGKNGWPAHHPSS